MITSGTHFQVPAGTSTRRKAVSAFCAFLFLTLAIGCGTSAVATKFSPNDDAATSGIQVHGHWTVTVYNSDGSVGRSSDFENNLYSSGNVLLAHLLHGKDSIGAHGLYVQLTDPYPSAQCAENTNHSSVSTSKINYVPATATLIGNNQLMISGVCTIKNVSPVITTSIHQVRTRFQWAEYAKFPNIGWSSLTYHTGSDMGLGDIFNGQILAFNVKLTFS